MDDIYKYDSFAIKKMIYDDVQKLSHHFYDNFYKFNTDHFDRWLESSEESLIEAFKLKYEFGVISTKALPDKLWGLSWVLCGPNTNKGSDAVSSDEMLMKYWVHPLHFTLEHTERTTGFWFARTYFLNNCSSNYMKGIC